MEVIFSIVALVALISLYDFYAARRWQQVTSVQRNDLVFENRNKAYGAYVIRKGYDKRLIIIIGGLMLAIGMAYGAYRIVKALPEDVVEVPKNNDAFAVAAPPVEDVPPPPPPPEIPPMERTVAFVPPVVTDEDVQEVKPVLNEDDKAAATDNKGSDVPNFELPPVVAGTPPIPEPPKDIIYDDVEEPAEFFGGSTALKQYLKDNFKYPETAIEAGIEGKCWLRFVVGADGKITDVRVTRPVPDCPECDAEAKRVVKGMPKWKPGKIDGKGVKSYFDLPVNFKLN